MTQLKIRTLVVTAFVLIALGLAGQPTRADWRTASRQPTGIAPDPQIERQAIVQVYGARAYSWRGYFGIHTWIATKPQVRSK